MGIFTTDLKIMDTNRFLMISFEFYHYILKETAESIGDTLLMKLIIVSKISHG